jgi:hypothetical protein
MSIELFHLELISAIGNKACYKEVKGILEKHPEAAKVKVTNGHLPLHYAIWIKNSDDVINLLFINYPEAALQNVLLLVTIDFSNLTKFYITLPCEQAVYV